MSLQVFIAGAFNGMRSMVTGRYVCVRSWCARSAAHESARDPPPLHHRRRGGRRSAAAVRLRPDFRRAAIALVPRSRPGGFAARPAPAARRPAAGARIHRGRHLAGLSAQRHRDAAEPAVSPDDAAQFRDWRLTVDGLVAQPADALARRHPRHAGAHPDHHAQLRRRLERDRPVDRRPARPRAARRPSSRPRRATSCSTASTSWCARPTAAASTTRASTCSTRCIRRPSSPTA